MSRRNTCALFSAAAIFNWCKLPSFIVVYCTYTIRIHKYIIYLTINKIYIFSFCMYVYKYSKTTAYWDVPAPQPQPHSHLAPNVTIEQSKHTYTNIFRLAKVNFFLYTHAAEQKRTRCRRDDATLHMRSMSLSFECCCCCKHLNKLCRTLPPTCLHLSLLKK